jgi:anti-anti-sigma factor
MKNARINARLLGRRRVSGRSQPADETAAAQAAAWGSTPDFALAVERREPGTATLVLGGELDLFNVPKIQEALAELIGAEGAPPPPDGVRHLVVDLRSVTFLDSTMLGLLLVASRRQLSQNGELRVLVGPRTPMTAFNVTGFDRMLAVVREDDTTESAA